MFLQDGSDEDQNFCKPNEFICPGMVFLQKDFIVLNIDILRFRQVQASLVLVLTLKQVKGVNIDAQVNFLWNTLKNYFLFYKNTEYKSGTNTCLSIMQKCDKRRDCPGGEDEVDCAVLGKLNMD